MLGHVADGGMGSVYRARDEMLGREVAVKTIVPYGGGLGDEFRERFFVEARCVAALAHANIVPVFDMGVEDGVPYLVMEILSGQSLKDYMSTGRLTSSQARSLGIQMANALCAAHEAGIVHRDIKPANILEGKPSQWKLVDFGVAQAPDSKLTGDGQFLGTPAYAAPETLEMAEFSTSGDIYGLAATLYEAVTGQLPYSAVTPIQFVIKAQAGPPPALSEFDPNVSPELEMVVAQGLSLDPARRPTASEFAEILARAGTGSHRAVPEEVTVAEPVSGGLPATDSPGGTNPGFAAVPAARGRKWRRGGVVLAVVIAGVGGALVLGGTGDTDDAAVSPDALAVLARLSPGNPVAKAVAPSESERPKPGEPKPGEPKPGEPKPGEPKLGEPEPGLTGLGTLDRLAKSKRYSRAVKAAEVLRRTHPKSAYLAYRTGSLYFEMNYRNDGFKAYRAAIGLDERYRSYAPLIRDAIRSLYSKSNPALGMRFLRKDIGAPARPFLEETLAGAKNPRVKGYAKRVLARLPE